jgi:hypothetical protein
VICENGCGNLVEYCSKKNISISSRFFHESTNNPLTGIKPMNTTLRRFFHIFTGSIITIGFIFINGNNKEGVVNEFYH